MASAQPPAYSTPPAPQPISPPYGQPAWNTIPQQPAPVRSGINPGLLIAGLVVVALVIGGLAIFGLKVNGSGPGSSVSPKSSVVSQAPATPTSAPTTTYAMSFTPTSVSCSSPVAFTTTTHLPSSVHSGDTITATFDGQNMGTAVVEEGDSTTQQPDGSWIDVSNVTADEMQAICDAGGQSAGVGLLTPGTHTMQIVDANGKVLAQGSYTVAASSKTPAPTKTSGIVFDPSTLSCSSPVDFTTTINLPSSVAVGDTLTSKLDGKEISTGALEEGDTTTQQPDGSWIDVSTSTATGMQKVCAAGGMNNGVAVLTTGIHTLQIVDESGAVLAQGSYTVTK